MEKEIETLHDEQLNSNQNNSNSEAFLGIDCHLARQNSLKGFQYKPRLQGSSFFGSKQNKIVIQNFKSLYGNLKF